MAWTARHIAFAAVVTATPSLAQTTPTPPAGSTTVIPEKESATPLRAGRSESLSSKLNKSGGVITPKDDVDPAMRVPAPDPRPNSTPVIPPSATGGNTAK